MTEDNPLTAQGSLGRLRADMWREALARHEAGRVRVTEVRASDYFGPGALADAVMGSRVLGPVVAGKTVFVMGDPDVPHSWTYIPDVARALVRVGRDEHAWGQVWHVPTAPAVSQRELIGLLAETAKTAPPRLRGLPWWVVTHVAGLTRPALRYMTQTRHQFDHPYVMDSSRFTAQFGQRATALEQAAEETVAWWRQPNAAVAATS